MEALPGIFFVSCIDTDDLKLILFRVNDPRSLFFLTRICDKRYWKYGEKWSISLSVGDSREAQALPIFYHLQPTKVRETFDLEVLSLLENMHWHLTHKAFIENFELEDFVLEAFRARIYDDFKTIVKQ